MSEHSLEYERKELNKALNLGIVGLVGAIIPIIGLILGFIALATGLPVDSKNSQIKSKKTVVTVVAVIAIVLSLLSGAGYYAFYHQRQVDTQKQAAQAQKAKDDAAQQQQFHDNAVQVTLKYCIAQADKAYNDYLEINSTNTTTGSDGQKVYYMPQVKWDYVNNKRTTDKDECYRAAANGDTSHALGI